MPAEVKRDARYVTAAWWAMIVVCVALPLGWEFGKACLRER